jgi:transposase
VGSSSNHVDAILLQKNQLLEIENERLHKRLAELVEKLATLEGDSAPKQLSLELKDLTEQVQGLKQQIFGDSSEKREFEKPPKESTKPRETTGRTPQDRLPHVDTLIELADDDRDCPVCDGSLEEMKGQSEDCEVIDVVQRKFIVRRIRRQKYRCRCQSAIVVAPPSILHIPHGRYTLDLGAYCFVQKYGWHEPLDR